MGSRIDKGVQEKVKELLVEKMAMTEIARRLGITRDQVRTVAEIGGFVNSRPSRSETEPVLPRYDPNIESGSPIKSLDLPIQRAIVLAYFMDGVATPEIASRFRLPLGTVQAVLRCQRGAFQLPSKAVAD